MISELELWTHFCLKRPKNLFELKNFELSDGFCLDLIMNAHWTEKFVRISESSTYRVFELMGIDCNLFPASITAGDRLGFPMGRSIVRTSCETDIAVCCT